LKEEKRSTDILIGDKWS